MSETLMRATESRLDERLLAQQTQVDRQRIREYLVELLSGEAIRMMVFWICPEESGVVFERPHVSQFPQEFDCDLCGNHHVFSDGRVEVHYLPSEEMKRRVALAL